MANYRDSGASEKWNTKHEKKGFLSFVGIILILVVGLLAYTSSKP